MTNILSATTRATAGILAAGILASSTAMASASVASIDHVRGVAAIETVRVANLSGERVFNVYVSPVADEYWGYDLLGEEVLLDGYYLDLALNSVDGCFYDVLVVYHSGREDMVWNVNLCTGGWVVAGQEETYIYQA